MRKLMNKIDRFCYTHPRFGIPNLMLIIVIGNAAVWLLAQMDTTGQIVSLLSGSAQGILHGQVWRLITYVFVPTESRPIWLLLMLYFYYWIGSCLEREWGNGKFTIYYVSGMLLTAVYGVVLSAILGRDVIVSTTYLNLSMFFAFATLYPDVQVLLFFIIPIKVKYLAYLDAALFVLGVITMPFPLNLLPVVAVLNYLVYCGDWLFDFFRPSHVRQRQKTVNFKREARRIQREQANKPYHYKCAVCGRTDADHPELEFRYCSRCVGYHCFCQDHINNHIHFTE
jgi:membrane associated rhomboid family serine protease